MFPALGGAAANAECNPIISPPQTMSNTLSTYHTTPPSAPLLVKEGIGSRVRSSPPYQGGVRQLAEGWLGFGVVFIFILNRPNYTGLNMLSTMAIDTLFAFAIMALLTPPAQPLACAGFCFKD